MKQHLRMHGQTWTQHFAVNWRFTRVALEAAVLTFGHGITPRVSGRRASELHTQLWDEGRSLSIADITHRVRAGLYQNAEDAFRDLDDHAALYREEPRLGPFRTELERLSRGTP